METNSPGERSRWRPSRRVLVACAATVAMAGFTQPSALAAPVVTPQGELPIEMQAQEKDQWCWAAAGNTIASFHGVDVTQTKFCQLAHNESGPDCQNKQGYLEDAQWALEQLGFGKPGNSIASRISFDEVASDIAAERPIETRIGWSSGGGHMHVLYGTGDSGTVSWGDPWPASDRYSTATYEEYSSNSEFQWTHTLAGIER